MRTDCFFAIGSSHTICQDYAIANGPFIALSDGCSSSEHTDVGARLLSLAAQEETYGWLAHESNDSGNWIIRRANSARNELGLSYESLDATLLMAYATNENKIHIRAFGDGAIALRRKSGETETWSIDYEHETPAYLSYLIHEDRRRRYLQSGYGRQIITRYIDGVEVDCEHIDRDMHSFGRPFGFFFDPSLYDMVCLFSDGVRSFTQTADTGGIIAVGMHEVISHIMAIKNANGAFLTRRCKAFLNRHCIAARWRHHDDFSAAAIWLNDDASAAEVAR